MVKGVLFKRLEMETKGFHIFGRMKKILQYSLETIEENRSGVEMQGVVTDYRENQSLAMHLSGKYSVVDVEWRIEEIGEHTRLTVYSNISFRSIIKILSISMRPSFKRKITKQLQEEFARLKELCERDN